MKLTLLFFILPTLLKCTTGNKNNDHKCVPRHLCKTTNLHKIEIDLRSFYFGKEEPCYEYLHVSCKISDILNELSEKPKEKPKECGIRNSNGVLYHTKPFNNVTQFGEFPWFVAIFDRTVSTRQPVFSGSLIHPQVVLTVAHRLQDVRIANLEVRAGVWDLQQAFDDYPTQSRGVESSSTPASFSYTFNELPSNDIALLFLAAPFDLTPTINVVCLPPQPHFDQDSCATGGWGRLEYRVGAKSAHILKRINAQLVNRPMCNLRLGSVLDEPSFQLDDDCICAGGDANGQTVCMGDGGSPLMCVMRREKEVEQYVQVGIVMGGVECGLPKVPNIYLNVAKFGAWIREESEKFGFII